MKLLNQYRQKSFIEREEIAPVGMRAKKKRIAPSSASVGTGTGRTKQKTEQGGGGKGNRYYRI